MLDMDGRVRQRRVRGVSTVYGSIVPGASCDVRAVERSAARRAGDRPQVPEPRVRQPRALAAGNSPRQCDRELCISAGEERYEDALRSWARAHEREHTHRQPRRAVLSTVCEFTRYARIPNSARAKHLAYGYDDHGGRPSQPRQNAMQTRSSAVRGQRARSQRRWQSVSHVCARITNEIYCAQAR